MDAQNGEAVYNIEREVGFVSGCLMLIKKEVFEKVGLLPEEYFMYYEDTDFCLSVLEGGYKIYYNGAYELSKGIYGSDIDQYATNILNAI